MKRALAISVLMLAAGRIQAAVIVSSTTCVQAYFAPGSLVFIEEFKADVLGSTQLPPAPAAPAVVVGAIPFWRPSPTSTNCYSFKGLNENGTPIPTKGDWVKCP